MSCFLIHTIICCQEYLIFNSMPNKVDEGRTLSLRICGRWLGFYFSLSTWICIKCGLYYNFWVLLTQAAMLNKSSSFSRLISEGNGVFILKHKWISHCLHIASVFCSLLEYEWISHCLWERILLFIFVGGVRNWRSKFWENSWDVFGYCKMEQEIKSNVSWVCWHLELVQGRGKPKIDEGVNIFYFIRKYFLVCLHVASSGGVSFHPIVMF